LRPCLLSRPSFQFERKFDQTALPLAPMNSSDEPKTFQKEGMA
jgi:hypothetical protein